jgi:hypothetical protein
MRHLGSLFRNRILRTLKNWRRRLTTAALSLCAWASSTFISICNLFRRALLFVYTTLLFQVYFVITYLICGRSSDRLWGKEGVFSFRSTEVFVEPRDPMWDTHYIWFFFATILALAAGGVVAGIVTNRVTQLKAVLISLPNTVFLVVMLLISGYTYTPGDAIDDHAVPFIIGYLLVLLVGTVVVYYSMLLSNIHLSEWIKFNRLHWLWLCVPYFFYSAGLLHAAAVHWGFIWYDLKDVLFDRFDFSWEHILKGVLERIGFFILLIVDFLITWALKVWWYPLVQTLKFLNGEFLASMPQWKARGAIFLLLLLGLPVAVLVEITCYYCLILLDGFHT